MAQRSLLQVFRSAMYVNDPQRRYSYLKKMMIWFSDHRFVYFPNINSIHFKRCDSR